MGRGKDFNHKRKGHQQQAPKHGYNVLPKNNGEEEYSIEPVEYYAENPVIEKNK